MNTVQKTFIVRDAACITSRDFDLVKTYLDQGDITAARAKVLELQNKARTLRTIIDNEKLLTPKSVADRIRLVEDVEERISTLAIEVDINAAHQQHRVA